MSSVRAAPDFSRLARRPGERLAIVEYVRDTPNLQETDYLEWKSAYDLSKRPAAAATSKHLIGFANRDFSQAARHAAGYAYLLLGVETGNLPGVPRWDSADIENWLVRFVGQDLRYDPHCVEADGKQVLFLLVDPPQQGDPIYCLQAQSSDLDGKTLREGSVYVRRKGLTELALAADIARLGRRAGPTTTELDLSVDLDASATYAIEAGWLWDATRDSYIEKERRRLYSGLPNPRDQQIGMLTPDFMEKRTRSEFQAEVETYAAALRDNWFAVHATHHVEAEESELVPILVNDTPSNFEDVVLELTLPFKDIYVYLEPEDAREELKPPEPPEEWAQFSALVARSVLPVMPSLPITERKPALEALDDDRSLIRFPAMHVRPRTRHRLHRLPLALPPEFAGKAVELSWRVTSRSTDGDLLGIAELVIKDGPLARREPPNAN